MRLEEYTKIEEIEEFDLIYEDEPWEASEEEAEDKTGTKAKEKPLAALEDGFILMKNNVGYVDLEYWSKMTGLSVEYIIEKANGKYIWQDPESYEICECNRKIGWLTREQYLMGNRIGKLRIAKNMDEKYGLFHENIRLLEANLPEEAGGEEIHVRLGATWILTIENFIGDFIAELLELRARPKVLYDPYRGKWTIDAIIKPNDIVNHYRFGTQRMSAWSIIDHKLNAIPIKVSDQIYHYGSLNCESVLNVEETLAAQEKGRLIDNAFQDYCHGDKLREEQLQRAYTRYFGYGITHFDGSYLSLDHLTESLVLRPHQKDAIAHMLSAPNILLADEVGSGKTNEYCCGIYKLLKLGLVSRVLVTAPNDTVDAACRNFRSLFPDIPTLAVSPRREFAVKNRKATINRIKNGEFQVVFMAYSSFDMLTMTKKYAFAEKDRELTECMRQIANATDYTQRTKLTALYNRMKKRTERYKAAFKECETACFDELGFDCLCVDEAHNYKNIPLSYSNDDIVGMHATGSKKCANMLEKVRYIQSRYGRVIFATGTPITNSLADLYVMQFYLQPKELKICNIYHFNDWISTFCEEETNFEVDVDSKNGRFKTRFSRFHNLPELMGMFSEVCHFYRSQNAELGLPAFRGYTDVVVKKSPEQVEYINELAERTEAIRQHEVSRKEDNLLKITVHGKMCGMDIRLVKPELAENDRNQKEAGSAQENKVGVCARNMARIYREYPGTTQIGFSDIGTPKEGFNIYDALKAALIAEGVPAKEIMFIHEADSDTKRARAERDFNAGKIRILIGSTPKLGTGVNVQERLIAVHHVDVPWRPADMVQREGRILRQGNTCEEVFIYRYITEASFDAYTYQLLENKQKFISQFLSGTLSAVHRDESDCSDTVLSYAEIKALAIGNPLIKERVEVSNELEHAKIRQRQKRKELLNLGEVLESLPERILRQRNRYRNTRLDEEYYAKHRETISLDERRALGEELLEALRDNVMLDKERVFSEYQGFDIVLPKHMKKEEPFVWLTGQSKVYNTNYYRIDMDTDKVLGCCKRLDYFLDHLDKEAKLRKKRVGELLVQQKQVKKDLDEGNQYDAVVAELAEKLDKIDEKLKEGNAA